jgi:hypothetical protein
MSNNRDDYWGYTPEDKLFIVNIGDEYFKDSAWQPITTEKEKWSRWL